MNYESGIESFDIYLGGKTLKQIRAVIHLTKYPKRLVLKIAKLFSSFPFGLPYEDIRNTILSEKKGTSKLIFETAENAKIVFSFKTKNFSVVKQFLDDIRLNYTFEKSIANKQVSTETKTAYNLNKRKKC